MTTIGLLHPGSMGAPVAACAVSTGHRVLWCPAGRSPATAARAQQCGVAGGRVAVQGDGQGHDGGEEFGRGGGQEVADLGRGHDRLALVLVVVAVGRSVPWAARRLAISSQVVVGSVPSRAARTRASRAGRLSLVARHHHTSSSSSNASPVRTWPSSW